MTKFCTSRNREIGEMAKFRILRNFGNPKAGEIEKLAKHSEITNFVICEILEFIKQGRKKVYNSYEDGEITQNTFVKYHCRFMKTNCC